MHTETFELPLGGTIVLRGMTGHEEDMLTNRKLMKSGEIINKIMGNCMVELNGEPGNEKRFMDLRSPDRLFALIEMRRLSYGDIVPMELNCVDRDCGGVTRVEYDLSYLPMKEATDEQKVDDPVFTTVVDGKVVKFTYMDGHKETKLAKLTRNNKDNEAELLTLGMMMRIIEVEGVHPNGLRKWLKDLPVRERRKLREAMEETECGYDTTITVACEECGRPIRVRVEAQPGFFFPEM